MRDVKEMEVVNTQIINVTKLSQRPLGSLKEGWQELGRLM